MSQVLYHFLILALFPFLTGAVVRLVSCKWREGWAVSVICAEVYLVSLAAMYIIPSRGSELYGLLNIMAAALMAGALLVELLLWRRRKDQREKEV